MIIFKKQMIILISKKNELIQNNLIIENQYQNLQNGYKNMNKK